VPATRADRVKNIEYQNSSPSETGQEKARAEKRTDHFTCVWLQ